MNAPRFCQFLFALFFRSSWIQTLYLLTGGLLMLLQFSKRGIGACLAIIGRSV
ncbi:hypothetical protein HOLleu_30397 [Holothuria leucospilota]|uniref:Uncharacterized protein n=1 Tax=Holothuria leucospilota TaxID=206669 RepID=A0A9Q1BK93_HOLLE|nr:hypothetical protein HOLleu_30397 [Holothuria leucospilota]